MIKVNKSIKRFAILLTGVVLAVILASYTFCNRENKDQVLVQLVTQTLTMAHFSPLDINDNFSEKVYNLYIKHLDFNKRFFTKEDLKNLEIYKTKIDDEIASKSVEFYAVTNELFDESLNKAQGYYTSILAQPFNLNENETFETDPDKSDFAQNDAALKEAWRKALKYQVVARVSDMMETQNKSPRSFIHKGGVVNSDLDQPLQKDDLSATSENDSQDKSKSDSVKKKTVAEMETEARAKVLKLHNDWFKRLRQTPDVERFGIFLNAITGIYDPHTQYLPPQDEETFKLSMSGQLEGIGAQLQESDDLTKVVDIVPGSASWLQGELKKGDIILKVAQENQKPVDIFGMRIEDVVKMVRGKKGTKVTLTIKKIDKTVKDITITRDIVIITEAYAKSAILEGPSGKVGYIYLPKFYANFDQTETGHSCAEDVALEIEKLKKESVEGIILDLRNNGGGSLADAVKMGGLFISRGPIVQVKTKNGNPRILEDFDPTIQYGGPLVIMVNNFSASASEILAAAMQDYKRAVIIGSPSTFGKGTVQTQMELDDYVSASYQNLRPLGSLLVTIQKFYRINGGATQLKGVTPDIILPDAYSEIELGEREQDYCMPWTKISPANYKPWTGLTNLETVVQKENASLAVNPDFKVIKEQALQFKKQHNETSVSLNLQKYDKHENEVMVRGVKYESLEKKSNGLKIHTLLIDDQEAKGDTAILVRTKNWVKDLGYDLYLKEAVQVVGFINTK